MSFGLNLPDFDAFVSLDVRAKMDAVTRRDIAHPRGVSANTCDVEEQRWSLESLQSHRLLSRC